MFVDFWCEFFFFSLLGFFPLYLYTDDVCLSCLAIRLFPSIFSLFQTRIFFFSNPDTKISFLEFKDSLMYFFHLRFAVWPYHWHWIEDSTSSSLLLLRGGIYTLNYFCCVFLIFWWFLFVQLYDYSYINLSIIWMEYITYFGKPISCSLRPHVMQMMQLEEGMAITLMVVVWG